MQLKYNIEQSVRYKKFKNIKMGILEIQVHFTCQNKL